MVHIALAGGAGNVGREILEVLLKSGKHKLTVLTRSAAPDLEAKGVTVHKADYTDKESLIKQLQGVHTVISFIVVSYDQDGKVQKTLVDASIEAGVKRFAPSEWAGRSNSGNPGYIGKDRVHEYLVEINKAKKVIEYTLFQPGLFTNYLAHPHTTTQHMHTFGIMYDLQHRRALVPEGPDFNLTFTTVQDTAKIVAAAVEYEGEWPEVGGISGTTLTNSQYISLFEKIRGGSFDVHKIPLEDLKKGKLGTTDWIPIFDHPSIPQEHRTKATSERILSTMLVQASEGGWASSDEWNKLLPEVEVLSAEEFLRGVWGDEV